MKSASHALLLLAATLINTPIAFAQPQRNTPAPVVVPVEYQVNDKAHAQILEKFRDVTSLRRLKLDIAFDLDAATIGGGARPKVLKRTISMGTDSVSRLEEVPCLTDRSYDLSYTGAHYFSLKLFENNDLVRLRIYPGDKTRFARNDASCIHDATAPGMKRFRIMGEYVAISVPTQQGVVVQLRPVE